MIPDIPCPYSARSTKNSDKHLWPIEKTSADKQATCFPLQGGDQEPSLLDQRHAADKLT